MIMLFLFGIYGLFAALVLLFGSQVYTRVVEDGRENAKLRTSLEYLSEKARQNDEEGAVCAGSFCGQDALVISREYEAGNYTT